MIWVYSEIGCSPKSRKYFHTQPSIERFLWFSNHTLCVCDCIHIFCLMRYCFELFLDIYRWYPQFTHTFTITHLLSFTFFSTMHVHLPDIFIYLYNICGAHTPIFVCTTYMPKETYAPFLCIGVCLLVHDALMPTDTDMKNQGPCLEHIETIRPVGVPFNNLGLLRGW